MISLDLKTTNIKIFQQFLVYIHNAKFLQSLLHKYRLTESWI